MKILRIFLALTLFLTSLNSASAAVSFSVKNEEIPKTKILFFGFDSADPKLKVDTFEIIERIRRNLKTTDLFEIIKQSGQVSVLNSSNISGTTVTAAGQGLMPTASMMPESLTVESTPNFEKYSNLEFCFLSLNYI